VPAAAPLTSVFYRFAISAILLFLFLLIRKQKIHFGWKHHRLFLIQGFFLFSINFVLTYIAKSLVSSGIVALSFTSLIYFNILGSKIYLKQALESKVLIGSFLGGLGILIFFQEEVQNFQTTSQTSIGILLAIASTICSSIGNILSAKTVADEVPISSSNAWSMLYGSFSNLGMALYLREDFRIPMTPSYLFSLGYLVIFATLLTFGAYILLVKRTGPAQAAYCNMISPLVALGLAAVFEGYIWTTNNILGVLFCILGSIFTLRRKS